MSFRRRLFTGNGVLLKITVTLLMCISQAWAGGRYRTLHTFTPGPGGYDLESGLVSDAAGNLYGTALHGGLDDSCCGTIFELAHEPNGRWKETVLYTFPRGGGLYANTLTFDQLGNLYGTTSAGGPRNLGIVFKLTQQKSGHWVYDVPYVFCSLDNCADGSDPVAGLTIDAAGNLYGTTQAGGNYGFGTVFKLAKSHGVWKEQVLYSFGGPDGKNPFGNLIFDHTGNLYGTTAFGGTWGGGVVFQLTPRSHGTWKERILHTFSGKDGNFPLAGLIFDQTGSLYGTTNGGGRDNLGVVFQLTPNSDGRWRESVLHAFRGNDGAYPEAGLVFDQQGNLYGTALEGGPGNNGTLFQLSRKSNGRWGRTVLHSFLDHPGALPYAGVIFGPDGSLYGTTSGYNGTYVSVFQIAP